jgi:aminoglycoside 6'-N-acetyltransferase I
VQGKTGKVAGDELEMMLLRKGDGAVLDRVAEGVFDGPILPKMRDLFLATENHLIVVGRVAGEVVGMATGVVYYHPDKEPQFWINEVGVGDDWLQRGIGRRLMRFLLAKARGLGCTYIWLGTEDDNAAALALYRSVGGAETERIVTFDWPGREDGGED